MNSADHVVYEATAGSNDDEAKYSSDEYTSDEESGVIMLKKAGMRRTALDATRQILLQASAEIEPLYAVSAKTTERQQRARETAAKKSTNRFSSSEESSESGDDNAAMPSLVESPKKKKPGEEFLPMMSMKKMKEQAETEVQTPSSRAQSGR